VPAERLVTISSERLSTQSLAVCAVVMAALTPAKSYQNETAVRMAAPAAQPMIPPVMSAGAVMPREPRRLLEAVETVTLPVREGSGLGRIGFFLVGLKAAPSLMVSMSEGMRFRAGRTGFFFLPDVGDIGVVELPLKVAALRGPAVARSGKTGFCFDALGGVLEALLATLMVGGVLDMSGVLGGVAGAFFGAAACLGAVNIGGALNFLGAFFPGVPLGLLLGGAIVSLG